MKIAILIGDGMGDYPLSDSGGRTPLQIAAIPNIRRAAGAGCVRLVRTVPDGMAPGSDVAILSIMGFDPARHYTGRAPIEAAGMGIEMARDDVAFRCNLVTVKDGLIEDHSAGHITTDEARPLVAELDRHLGRNGLRFVAGAGYRHLLLWKDGPADVATTPPHDVLSRAVEDNLPKGGRSGEVLRLMEESKALLAEHPANKARREAGKKPATQIWLWGQGRACFLPSYRDMYGLSGGVISAVDLVRGIGRLAGLEAVRVPGATGFTDTNYVGKAGAALELLRKHDFAFVHLEAPDECSHMGDADLKIEAIEAFDREIVGPVWAGLESMGHPYRLVIGTDHRTPVSVRNHSAEPVPVIAVQGPVPEQDTEGAFDEFADGGRVSGMAFEWIQTILKRGKEAIS
jgi:2,3-bisphosphoglycerate-independent phosphoglycerate mutase